MTEKGPRFVMNEWTTVITEEGDVAPVGEVGLLARRGHVPVGYYKDPVKTAATFTEMHGVRWAIPGDRAVIEDDGKINVLGRGSQCINTGGEKVFPEEVEAVLKSQSRRLRRDRRRRARRTVGRERRRRHRAPGRARMSRSTRSASTAAPSLAGYKVPRKIVVVDAVERTPAGKPNYRWAKEMAVAAP